MAFANLIRLCNERMGTCLDEAAKGNKFSIALMVRTMALAEDADGIRNNSALTFDVYESGIAIINKLFPVIPAKELLDYTSSLKAKIIEGVGNELLRIEGNNAVRYALQLGLAHKLRQFAQAVLYIDKLIGNNKAHSKGEKCYKLRNPIVVTTYPNILTLLEIDSEGLQTVWKLMGSDITYNLYAQFDPENYTTKCPWRFRFGAPNGQIRRTSNVSVRILRNISMRTKDNNPYELTQRNYIQLAKRLRLHLRLLEYILGLDNARLVMHFHASPKSSRLGIAWLTKKSQY